MFLKRRVRRKDGKDHVCHSVCESLWVHGGHTLQRQILHLGEHKEAFAAHLAAKWKDLFAAGFDISLCDLTSTCCEGSAEAVHQARRSGPRQLPTRMRTCRIQPLFPV